MTRRRCAALAFTALTVAGCGGGGARTTTVARTLGPPACTRAVARPRELTGVRDTFTALSGTPFGVAVARDGRYAFVSDPTVGIKVLSGVGGRLRLAHVVRLPAAISALGLDLVPDGRELLAASGSGAAVLSVRRLEQGRTDALLGTLAIPGHAPTAGAIEVTTSRDGRYVFASVEYSAEVSVFDLRRAEATRFQDSGFVGAIPTGQAPVGMAVSPDDRWLYVTSELARGASPASDEGSVSTIALATAERTPGRSVVSSAPAGCEPVRLVLTGDGRHVLVTARASDAVEAFSASALQHRSADAPVGVARVGNAPVGIALVDGGRRLVVGDSNRFHVSGGASDLIVLDTAALLRGRPAVIGRLRAGGFPREMALSPDGRRLLVTDFASGQLQTVAVGGLP